MKLATELKADDFFRRASASYLEKRPFVIYSKPGSTHTIGIFQSDGVNHQLTGFDQEGYVLAPFSGNHAAIIPADHSEVFILKDGFKGIAFPDIPAGPGDAQERTRYEMLVRQAIEAIQHKQFDKVVLSRCEQVLPDHSDFVSVYKKLAGMYQDAYTYCWYQPGTGMWLGAFAEQLARVTDESLFTMALAGTRPWAEGKTDWGSKELEEQKYVTSFIVDRINSLTDGITTGPLSTVKAGRVVHLRTDIHAEISKDTTIGQIIEALHPTPAVCGWPQKEARSFILQKEGYDREYYSGYHGELNCDFENGDRQTDLFVNLRCMKLEQDGAGRLAAHIYVGGGITADSDPESEWQETVNKAETMKKVLFN